MVGWTAHSAWHDCFGLLHGIGVDQEIPRKVQEQMGGSDNCSKETSRASRSKRKRNCNLLREIPSCLVGSRGGREGVEDANELHNLAIETQMEIAGEINSRIKIRTDGNWVVVNRNCDELKFAIHSTCLEYLVTCKPEDKFLGCNANPPTLQQILGLFNATTSNDLVQLGGNGAGRTLNAMKNLGYEKHEEFKGLWKNPPGGDLAVWHQRHGEVLLLDVSRVSSMSDRDRIQMLHDFSGLVWEQPQLEQEVPPPRTEQLVPFNLDDAIKQAVDFDKP